MSRHGVGRDSMAGALRTAHGAVLGRYARPLGEPHRAHVDGLSVAVHEPCESSRANSSWPGEDLLRHGHRGVVDSGPTQSRWEKPSRASVRWSTPCHRPQGPLAPVGDSRPLHVCSVLTVSSVSSGCLPRSSSSAPQNAPPARRSRSWMMGTSCGCQIPASTRFSDTARHDAAPRGWISRRRPGSWGTVQSDGDGADHGKDLRIRDQRAADNGAGPRPGPHGHAAAVPGADGSDSHGLVLMVRPARTSRCPPAGAG